MLISDIGLYFSFMGLSLSGFGIRVMAASQNEFENIVSSAIVLEREARPDNKGDVTYKLDSLKQ